MVLPKKHKHDTIASMVDPNQPQKPLKPSFEAEHGLLAESPAERTGQVNAGMARMAEEQLVPDKADLPPISHLIGTEQVGKQAIDGSVQLELLPARRPDKPGDSKSDGTPNSKSATPNKKLNSSTKPKSATRKKRPLTPRERLVADADTGDWRFR